MSGPRDHGRVWEPQPIHPDRYVLDGEADQRGSTQLFRVIGLLCSPGSGLLYLLARTCDSAIGRYLSRDPCCELSANPLSLNRYSYAQNNPVLLTDPTGLCENTLVPADCKGYGGGEGGPVGGAGATAEAGPNIGAAIEQSVAAVEEWVQLRLPLEEAEGNRVPYGSSDLSQKVIAERQALGALEHNGAVFEYEAGGRIQYEIRFSSQSGHAERQVWRELEEQGIPPGAVRRIYSELEPCSYAGCKSWISRTFLNTSVSWSFDYGADALSRRAGMAALKRAVRLLFR